MKSRAQLGTGTHDALRPACPTSSDFRKVLVTGALDFCKSVRTPHRSVKIERIRLFQWK